MAQGSKQAGRQAGKKAVLSQDPQIQFISDAIFRDTPQVTRSECPVLLLPTVDASHNPRMFPLHF